jgi:putative ABC transport system ATP-binding protein
MSILRTEKLEKIYRSDSIAVHALKGVDMRIDRGEFVAIVGPSGSGKSTLLNIIGGLDTPSKGKVFLEDVDLSTVSANELAEIRLHKIGFIFQAYNLIPVLTVEENVEFIMMLQHVPKSARIKKVKELLEEIGIGEYLTRRPDKLSGGQQQRVAVARAIVSEPLLVLADEPTANLDSESGTVLLDLMESMNRKKNITFVFSTHDPQVMERAHRLLILKDGSIVEDRNQSP